MKREKHTTELLERLRDFQASDRGERLAEVFLRWIEDPLKPRTDKQTLRVNRILLVLAGLVIAAAGTLLFFSVVQL